MSWRFQVHPDADQLHPQGGVMSGFKVELDKRIENKIRASFTERILREAGLDRQVVDAIAAIKKPTATVLADGITQLFTQEPDREWRDHIEEVAQANAGNFADRRQGGAETGAP
jgi:hypothetical protein